MTCPVPKSLVAPERVSCCPPAAPAPSGREPRACVLGLGNALAGEHLAGLLAVEALAQELDQAEAPNGVNVGLLAQGFRHLPSALWGMDAAVFVLGLPEPPCGARVRSLRLDPQDDDRDALGLGPLRASLARLSLVQELPGEMLAVAVEASEFEGEGLAFGFRQAMRRAVVLVVDYLAERGVCEPDGRQVSRLYTVPWLGVSF